MMPMTGRGALVENVLVRAWYVDSQGVVVMISMGACLFCNVNKVGSINYNSFLNYLCGLSSSLRHLYL